MEFSLIRSFDLMLISIWDVVINKNQILLCVPRATYNNNSCYKKKNVYKNRLRVSIYVFRKITPATPATTVIRFHYRIVKSLHRNRIRVRCNIIFFFFSNDSLHRYPSGKTPVKQFVTRSEMHGAGKTYTSRKYTYYALRMAKMYSLINLVELNTNHDGRASIVKIIYSSV